MRALQVRILKWESSEQRNYAIAVSMPAYLAWKRRRDEEDDDEIDFYALSPAGGGELKKPVTMRWCEGTEAARRVRPSKPLRPESDKARTIALETQAPWCYARLSNLELVHWIENSFPEEISNILKFATGVAPEKVHTMVRRDPRGVPKLNFMVFLTFSDRKYIVPGPDQLDFTAIATWVDKTEGTLVKSSLTTQAEETTQLLSCCFGKKPNQHVRLLMNGSGDDKGCIQMHMRAWSEDAPQLESLMREDERRAQYDQAARKRYRQEKEERERLKKQKADEDADKNIPCRKFPRGKCNSPTCPHLHVGDPTTIDCWFHLKGGCGRPETCPYRHPE